MDSVSGKTLIPFWRAISQLLFRSPKFYAIKMLETADDITLRNPSEAIDYYLKAAADGNAKAQLRVGVYFFEAGSGYDALRYFKKAVEPRKNDRGYGYIPTGTRLALI